METFAPKLSRRTVSVKSWLEAQPGACAVPLSARKSSAPIALMYKVMDNIFAILALRGTESVIVKCDPHLVHYASLLTAEGHFPLEARRDEAISRAAR